MKDSIICIYSISEDNPISQALREHGYYNIFSITSIDELFLLKNIDILYICERKNDEVLQYIDTFKKCNIKAKIVCIVNGDTSPMTINSLIINICDYIIRKNDKKWLSSVIKSADMYTKIRQKDEMIRKAYIKEKRKNSKTFQFGRRKEDYIYANFA